MFTPPCRSQLGRSQPALSCPYPAWESPVRVRLTVMPEHACAYLPGRMAQSRGFLVDQMPGRVYHHLMNAGFRRSGKLIYQPVCRGCRQCLPIRVPVARFAPNKSQRRCDRRYADLQQSIGSPVATDEKWELYRRYVADWHGGQADDRASFEAFLYESPVETIELCHRDAAGRLLAVGICDLCAESLSSVYFYFDPSEAARGLGTFGALREIQLSQQLSLPYYYLGYWIDGCRAMSYKSQYRVHEMLHPDNVWRPGQ